MPPAVEAVEIALGERLRRRYRNPGSSDALLGAAFLELIQNAGRGKCRCQRGIVARLRGITQETRVTGDPRLRVSRG